MISRLTENEMVGKEKKKRAGIFPRLLNIDIGNKTKNKYKENKV